LVEELLRSGEPSIRWRTRVRVLGQPRGRTEVVGLEREVRRSRRVRRLLSHRDYPYRRGTARNVYYKWQGIHWVLASLADLGYPPGDLNLRPLIDRALELWLRPWYLESYTVRDETKVDRTRGVPIVRGRARRCASQHGNALYYMTKLGFVDERADRLASLLRAWQWPDGGWNCDPTPTADSSSFMETLTPMRGLAAYAARTGDRGASAAARRAAEVFLERRLFRRRSNGSIIKPDFVRLHYPLYYHYDVLGGLKGMVEVGRINDPRCRPALDWLEAKELPDGGWPAEARYYRVSPTLRSSSEFVDWGGVDRGRRNDWVTTDALFVLTQAGRREM
jgi:hypothetical protein